MHSDSQIEQMPASLHEWGLDKTDTDRRAWPRARCASTRIDRSAGIVARGWTNAPKRAYVLADNKLAFRMGVATIALINTVAHFGAKEAAALASIADGSFDRAWVAPKRDWMMNT